MSDEFSNSGGTMQNIDFGFLIYRCDSCAFWDRKNAVETGEGLCKRRAPHPSADEDFYWPVVGEADWCGEFIKRPETVKKERPVSEPPPK